MPSPPTNRILEFEGLRGLLAWWVVVSHALFAAGFTLDTLPRGIRILAHGDYAVDVFIILSGFVIFKLLREGKEPWRVFMVRRVFRLFPVYLLCLFAGILVRP